MEITLVLSLEEVNAILNVLGQAPYVQSAPLIAKITESAQAQIQSAEPTASVEVA